MKFLRGRPKGMKSLPTDYLCKDAPCLQTDRPRMLAIVNDYINGF